MKYRLVTIAGAFVLLCLPLQAWATGGLDCSISDGNLDFHYEALFNYSANSPLFQGKAEFVSKHPNTHPTLKTLDADKLRLIQQWYEGKDLRLQFYAETEGDTVPFGSVKLTIETTAAEDELSYDGAYKFEITPAVKANAENETVELAGKVSCSAG